MTISPSDHAFLLNRQRLHLLPLIDRRFVLTHFLADPDGETIRAYLDYYPPIGIPAARMIAIDTADLQHMSYRTIVGWAHLAIRDANDAMLEYIAQREET
jgi:hypothetical protein